MIDGPQTAPVCVWTQHGVSLAVVGERPPQRILGGGTGGVRDRPGTSRVADHSSNPTRSRVPLYAAGNPRRNLSPSSAVSIPDLLSTSITGLLMMYLPNG